MLCRAASLIKRACEGWWTNWSIGTDFRSGSERLAGKSTRRQLDALKAKAEFERAQKIGESFHKRFDCINLS